MELPANAVLSGDEVILPVRGDDGQLTLVYRGDQALEGLGIQPCIGA